MEMFVGASHDIESIIGAAISTDPGGTNIFFSGGVFQYIP